IERLAAHNNTGDPGKRAHVCQAQVRHVIAAKFFGEGLKFLSAVCAIETGDNRPLLWRMRQDSLKQRATHMHYHVRTMGDSLTDLPPTPIQNIHWNLQMLDSRICKGLQRLMRIVDRCT